MTEDSKRNENAEFQQSEDKVEDKLKEGEKAEQKKAETDKEEEEIKKKLLEQLEKIRVEDLIAEMLTSLMSIGYMKMGLPEEANLKFRDLDQAKLAIDSLAGLIKSSEHAFQPKYKEPLKATLANMQLNYVQLSRSSKQEEKQSPSAEDLAGAAGARIEKPEKAEESKEGE